MNAKYELVVHDCKPFHISYCYIFLFVKCKILDAFIVMLLHPYMNLSTTVSHNVSLMTSQWCKDRSTTHRHSSTVFRVCWIFYATSLYTSYLHGNIFKCLKPNSTIQKLVTVQNSSMLQTLDNSTNSWSLIPRKIQILSSLSQQYVCVPKIIVI